MPCRTSGAGQPPPRRCISRFCRFDPWSARRPEHATWGLFALAARGGWARAVWAAIEDEPGSRAQAAIRFVLGDPRVGGVLVGSHLPEHVSEAVAAVDMAPFAPDTETALARLYANDFGRLS